MYRKIAIIFISVFLIRFGVITQALVVFILLIIFLVVTLKKKPFQTVVLNNLEILSLISSMTSVFCGLFYLVDIDQSNIDSSSVQNDDSGKFVHLNEEAKLFFFSMIIITNGIFFLYFVAKILEEGRSMFIMKF